MKRDDFQNFKDQLSRNLQLRDEVIGLVFVGSAANVQRSDEWSDHDFFVFSKNGADEALRLNLDWLPHQGNIAASVRETDHGLKVIYDDGHILEFAVFDEDWDVRGVNDYEIAFDTAHISERMRIGQSLSVPRPVDIRREQVIFISHLLIGVGRARRGELLTASQFVKGFATSNLINLVSATLTVSGEHAHTADNQNPYRRFEARFPHIASRLNTAQLESVEKCARILLEIFEEIFCQDATSEISNLVQIVKKRFSFQDH